MSRTFKVGDIVNASSNGFELTKKPVKEIAGNYIRVCTFLFTPDELTLVTSVEPNRGVEQYKDQFSKWRRGRLVTDGAETITELTKEEKKVRRIANAAIRRMMKGQQA